MKIALWQCEQRSADTPGNLERLQQAIGAAAAGGAELLICPEMVLTGYHLDLPTLQRLAEPVEGPSARAVAGFARQAGVAVVWGFPELGPDGAVYNAVLAVDAGGQRIGQARKAHLYGDHDRGLFQPGDAANRLFELAGWRVGMLICYDVEFPEAVRGLALAGADLVVVPTANMQGFESVPRLMVPARAYENQLVVAYANCCGREGSLVYGGLSSVAGPDGRLLAQACTEPALLVADIGAPVAPAQRLPYLQDRRPGTYRRLLLSEPPQE